MGQILRNWRIPIAAVFSVVLIIGAYILARGIESPTVAQASAETALLQAIATKDSDGDGLPDWEEALYGTDANTIDTFSLGITDGEAVAKGLIVPKAIADITVTTSIEGTLTDAFAKNFFTLYIAAKTANGGNELSAEDTNNIVNQALDSLSSSVSTAPDFKSAKDIIVSDSGESAQRAFAADAEAVFKKNISSATTSELIYLQYAIADNDVTALTNLASIAKAYRDGAAGLAALPVPRELAAGDLALVNAMMRVSEIINDFAHVNVDSLGTMLALQQYVPAARFLGNAFADISNTYAAAGIAFPAGTPGAVFVNIADKKL